MSELRRGAIISGAYLATLFKGYFNRINALDYSQMSLTSGQFIRVQEAACDLLSVHSDQYYKTDIIPDEYAGEDVSYFQRYLDEIENIKEGE